MQDTEVACNNSWKLYYTTNDAWEAMYDTCSHAVHSIYLEQYIFENDECGQIFLELFIKKAQEGVKIFLLCDRFGSRSLYDSQLIKRLKELGAEVHFYNDAFWLKLIFSLNCFPRTHIKTLLVDSAVAYTGGVCFAHNMKEWRDTHIKIQGQIIPLIAQSFWDAQQQVKSRKFSFYFTKKAPHLNSCECTYIVNSPRIFGNYIYRAFNGAIREAKKEIYITTSFFVPNKAFMLLLKRTAQRGVAISILVPEYSDKRLADWTFRSYAGYLLKAGIKIYCFQKTILHAKTMVIDENWVTVGSANMDILSFFYNREANIVCHNTNLAKELKQQFANDLLDSKSLTLQDIKQMSWLEKLFGYIGRGIKLFLPRRD